MGGSAEGRRRNEADVELATDGSSDGGPPSGCGSGGASAEPRSAIRLLRTGSAAAFFATAALLAPGAAAFVGAVRRRGAVANNAAALYSPPSLTTYSPTGDPNDASFHVENFYGASPSAEPNDLFLLGGQSNMVGHTTGGQSLGGHLERLAEIPGDGGQYWSDLKSALDALGAETRIGSLRSPGDATGEARGSALYEAVYGAHAGFDGAAEIARTLTSETMKLFDGGLLDRIDSPTELGSCSFREPLNIHYDDNQRPVVQDTSSGIRPLVPGSNCGHSFGHELLFGRTLELQLAQGDRYEMVKYASDGTVINEYWLPNEGMFWDGLNSTIHSRGGRGNWKAFVWHQGESSAFTRKGEDQSLTYLGNLTALVTAVRGEMHSASPGFWECPEAIPVVIVQLGAWPGGAEAGRIREAQARFCESDARSALVTTDDLSPYYHFDPLSFLISGNRIARAYDRLRTGESEYVCPGHASAPLDEKTGEMTAVKDSAGTTAYDEVSEGSELVNDGFSFSYRDTVNDEEY